MNSEQPKALMPMISVDSVDAARSFYVDKLGFSHMMGMLGKDGQLDFCTVMLDGARIMLARPPQPMEGTGQTASKRPVEIYLEVGDVNAYHDKLRAGGVEIATQLTDQWWGDRTFTVMDPFGYHIWFWQTVGEMKPPPGAKIV